MKWFFFITGQYGTKQLNDTTAWTGSAGGIQVLASTTFTKIEATRNNAQVDVIDELISDGSAAAGQGAILRLPDDESITAVTISSGGNCQIVFDENHTA